MEALKVLGFNRVFGFMLGRNKQQVTIYIEGAGSISLRKETKTKFFLNTLSHSLLFDFLKIK